MANSADELRLEFDATRREIDEMAAEIAAAEGSMTLLTRQDVQASDLRIMLADTKARHARLQERAQALRTKFSAVGLDRPNRTH